VISAEEMKQFQIGELPDDSEAAFKRWSADTTAKYGKLGRAYVTLKDCYDTLLLQN